MQIEQVRLEDIKPYENNPRLNDNAVEAVANSIREFGFKNPIIVDAEGVIVAGHTRYKAAQALELQQVPVIRADDLTPEQVRAFRLADNKTAELAEWDLPLLDIELEKLGTFDMSDFGFELPDFDDDDTEITEDEAPEEVETRCKLGDIWQLGDHKLICGDSTDPAVIDRLMDGVKAKLLLTDPPYGIDVVKGNKVDGDKAFGKVDGGGQTKFGKVGGRNIVKSKTYSAIIGDDTTDTAKANYDVALTCTENQIIFGGNYFTDFLPPSRCWIVWDKQNTGNFADAELAWTSFDRGVKLYHFLWNGLCREGSREVEGKTRVHPTQKPVGMLADILKDFSEENDSILDCFGGSGSTLIACEQLNRKRYMCELDEHYCSVILQRYINFKGSDADVFLLKDGKKIPYSEAYS